MGKDGKDGVVWERGVAVMGAINARKVTGIGIVMVAVDMPLDGHGRHVAVANAFLASSRTMCLKVFRGIASRTRVPPSWLIRIIHCRKTWRS